MTIRPLSVSEVSTALDCMARWDFSYGGHLAGDALESKRTLPVLRGGRAFGRGAAAWHSGVSKQDALQETLGSLEEDAERQREFGVLDREEHDALGVHLVEVLDHYADLAERFHLETPERRFLVPILSRSSSRASSRYRLESYVDGILAEHGETWIVEFKLRGHLSDVRNIALSRQLRWYAWAFWQETGRKVTGALTVERLNVAPKPPRLVQTGRKDKSLRPSHAKDQLTTATWYRRVCSEHDLEPDPETLEALATRRWQQEVPVRFLDGELEEAGRELTSAAKLIRDLDSGELMPLRNAKPQNCNGCRYRDICAHPDRELVDALFERKPPKRDRAPEKEKQAA